MSDAQDPSQAPKSTNADATADAGSWQATLRKMDEIRQLEQRVAGLKRHLVTGDQVAASPRRSQSTSMLLVRLGGRLVALPMDRVEEVVRMVTLTPTDATVVAVIGLADYHGRPVAVVDTRGLLGEPVAPIRASQAVVFCRLPPLYVGIRVDEIVDVTQIDETGFSPTEEVLPGGLRCAGVARTSEGTALVLEPLFVAVAAELVSLPDPGEKRS